MKVVYESYSQPEAIYVKSILEDSGIEALFFDPKKSEMLPALDFTEEFIVTVEDDIETKALEIVNGLRQTQ